ncbi:MAG: ABC1 family protein [uncultured Sulfurovum sp.]|uniref:ABC1 family protein n=1 Tax=uncultured Sulfurovum sp. TaxID=269237 RepID=A0A6S6SQD1_9BACT|nr:MAG: ABC1 family protein [uncultured Sulfurovum sp.]
MRVYGVFRFLLTLFLVIKKKDSFLGVKPLSPTKLKETIGKLGASFVKLAQVLATRADFFTPEYLEELKELHDQLPAMSQEAFNRVSLRALNLENFKSFDKNPIASASIGQVHVAYLHDGTKVAVKLRREGIKNQVLADIKILNFFNTTFRPLFSFYTKNSIDAVISEFSKMIKEEVNLSKELQNLQKFSMVYKESGVRFPIPYPQYCSEDCIVMSFEEGYRFDDKKSIYENNIDFNAIIAKLVDFYTSQMLINGYFHADPHPGNLLVTKEGELVLLDFGMVKTVPSNTRIAIIELIKASNEQDYERYISANKKLGTIAYEAPLSAMAEFTEKMFEIFSDENLDSESMQKLAFEILESTRNFPFKLPSDAIYILRVSAIIEGLGTTYIENFNGVKDILPILQKNIPKALGGKEKLSEMIVAEVKEIPFVVKELKNVIKKASEGTLEIELSKAQLGWIAKELKTSVKVFLSGFTLVLAGFFMLMYDRNLDTYALILFGFGFFRMLVW